MSPAEARRRRVLALLARANVQYAVLVEDPNTDPVVMTVGTPGGTREVLQERVNRWDTGRADP